jgi:phosphoglycerol transferase MdoB-like AlkP superfamily enzyme
VFPKLGFDEFIDINSFSEADKSGPYVGDLAVARTVESLLDQHAHSVFIFVITMENHGPLHWERVNAAERATLFSSPLPAECDELAVYARHLRNADAMLGQLRTRCEAARTPHWLCQYGDHVPIMPAVYAALGEPDGGTDYVLWGNRATGSRRSQDIDIADLAALLLANVAGEGQASSSG